MDVNNLKPGDVLLYDGKGFISRAIRTKTWSEYSHCECFIGNGASVASRDGIGVGRYPLRTSDLALVLRPNQPFDLQRGMQWFATVSGQGYDWFGLFAFFFASWEADPNKMFCSEFLTRFERQCGLKPFSAETDADHVSPGMFAQSTAYDVVWERP